MATASIVLEGKNRASAMLKQVSAEMANLDKQGSGAFGDFDSTLGKLTGGLGGLAGVLGIAGVAGAAMQAGTAIADAVTQADKVHSLRAAFDSLATGAGQSGEAILAAMRSASLGMVSDSDLMLAANKANMLGVADNAEELSKLLEIARVRGKAMGLDLGQAFDNIVTGIGRESALILDNLGIVVDTDKAMKDYAATLGTTAAALDSVQRKQAILNQIMANTPTGGGLPSGTAMAQAQLARAQEEAQVAVGDFFSSGYREALQAQIDIIGILAGKYNALGVVAREVGDALADKPEQFDAEQVTVMTAYIDAVNKVAAAEAMGAENAQLWADTLYAMGGAMRQGVISDATVTNINAIIGASEREIAALQRAKQQAADYDMMLQVMAGTHITASSNMITLGLSADKLQGKLNALGAAANATGIAVHNAFVGAVDLLGVEGALQGLTAANRELAQLRTAWAISGVTGTELELREAEFIAKTNQGLADQRQAIADANSEAKKYASEGVSSVTKAYSDLESKVAGVLNQQLSLSVDWPGKDQAGGDAINENAKRLAAIANEGLIGQSWLEEFKTQVPDIYQALVDSGDPQGAAQQMLRDFQLGLKPELLDKEQAKKLIHDMIVGEQSMAQLASEIAAELSQEMGISLADATTAAQTALGVKPTAIAGDKAGDGAAESGQATKFVSAWVLDMTTQYTRIYATGVTSGEQWGSGFLAAVQPGVPAELIGLLVTLITPEVLARIRTQATQTGAIP